MLMYTCHKKHVLFKRFRKKPSPINTTPKSHNPLINPTFFQTSILYMKRFRFGEEIDHQMDTAGVLMLLSRGHDGQTNKEDCQPLISPPRVFQCKTCSRQFRSFQALGGHRASHKKPRADGACNNNVQAKPRMHECSVCGLEFAVGQALGGHMRRHRAHDAQGGGGGGGGGEKKRVWLDLNLPPMESYEMKNIPMVDCFH